VDPRTGVDDMEKRKFLTLPGLELRPLTRPARIQSLYRLPTLPAPNIFIVYYTLCIYYTTTIFHIQLPLLLSILCVHRLHYMNKPFCIYGGVYTLILHCIYDEPYTCLSYYICRYPCTYVSYRILIYRLIYTSL
jgi:hypothetical protein